MNIEKLIILFSSFCGMIILVAAILHPTSILIPLIPAVIGTAILAYLYRKDCKKK